MAIKFYPLLAILLALEQWQFVPQLQPLEASLGLPLVSLSHEVFPIALRYRKEFFTRIRLVIQAVLDLPFLPRLLQPVTCSGWRFTLVEERSPFDLLYVLMSLRC